MQSSSIARPVVRRQRDTYDVVVIGSGYGGAIAASRMARARRADGTQLNVALLERGREWLTGGFPDTALKAVPEMQISFHDRREGAETALYDLHVHDDLHVFVACGLGGGSLINAGAAVVPDPRVFADPLWPSELREEAARISTLTAARAPAQALQCVDLDDDHLADGYVRAAQMLRPAPYPRAWPTPAKLKALEAMAASTGAACARVPINVHFGAAGPNHVGVEQAPCAGCGDCMTGCNHGAKNTLMMNYLPDAKRHGAEIYTHAIVTHLTRDPKGEHWLVHYRMAGSGEQDFHAAPNFVRAELVVLAAGALGSTEILLRSREQGLALSAQLGRQFTGNGDAFGFAYGMADRVNGVGSGGSLPPRDDPVGPCITGIIDLRDPARPLDDGMVIEEGALAGAMAPLLPAAFGFSETLWGEGGQQRISGWLRESWYKFAGMAGAAYRGKMAHTQTLLVMSHDGATGRVLLREDRVRVDWPGAGNLPENQKIHDELKRLALARSGIYVRNPIWSQALGHQLVSVHPLGGCPMGESGATGVVNHKHQVFRGEGHEVQPGLYVMDGAVVRRSVGVNPLMTISALAERACACIARDRGWTIDYGFGLVGNVSPAPKPAVGLRFTETMRGVLAPGADLDFDTAAADGEAAGLECQFTLTVEAADLDALVDDATHFAALSGTFSAHALSARPLAVSDGRFHVFVLDPDNPAARMVRYRMRLTAEDGHVYWFEGVKRIRDDPGPDLWTDITTLFASVHDGADASAPVVARGILTIHHEDLLTQILSMRVDTEGMSWPQRIRSLKSLGKLARFMGGEMWRTYGRGDRQAA